MKGFENFNAGPTGPKIKKVENPGMSGIEESEKMFQEISEQEEALKQNLEIARSLYESYKNNKDIPEEKKVGIDSMLESAVTSERMPSWHKETPEDYLNALVLGNIQINREIDGFKRGLAEYEEKS